MAAFSKIQLEESIQIRTCLPAPAPLRIQYGGYVSYKTISEQHLTNSEIFWPGGAAVKLFPIQSGVLLVFNLGYSRVSMKQHKPSDVDIFPRYI